MRNRLNTCMFVAQKQDCMTAECIRLSCAATIEKFAVLNVYIFILFLFLTLALLMCFAFLFLMIFKIKYINKLGAISSSQYVILLFIFMKVLCCMFQIIYSILAYTIYSVYIYIYNVNNTLLALFFWPTINIYKARHTCDLTVQYLILRVIKTVTCWRECSCFILLYVVFRLQWLATEQ